MTTNAYKTKQRELILEHLKNNKDRHLTIEDISNYLKKQNTKVGQTTIYRYVNMLVDEGYVKKYVVDVGESACFQYAEYGQECETHYHLKCSTCKEILHVNCKEIKNVEKALKKEHNFEMHASKLLIYGICGKCSKVSLNTIEDNF